MTRSSIPHTRPLWLRVGLVAFVVLIVGALRVMASQRSYMSLDSHFVYSWSYAEQLIGGLTADERGAYTRTGLMDLGFIVFYGFAFHKLLSPRYVRWRWVAMVPLVTALADLGETTTGLLVLQDLAPTSLLVVSVVCTPIKWTGVMLCLFGLLTSHAVAQDDGAQPAS